MTCDICKKDFPEDEIMSSSTRSACVWCLAHTTWEGIMLDATKEAEHKRTQKKLEKAERWIRWQGGTDRYEQSL